MNKTITLTDKQYDFLIQLSLQLQTQDNRITADPIFCVYQKERRLQPDGFGENQGFLDEEGNLSDKDEGTQDNPTKEVEFSVKDVPVSGQCYFTEKAAQQHIAQNSYHYDEPFVYVESAWRNYEWQSLREIILSLAQKEVLKT